MSNHSNAHDVRKDVRKYVLVFVALLFGTAITVGISYAHFESVPLTITIALFIASIKGFLVAGYFMHLISERRAIYGILLSTVFFFIGLVALTLWSMSDIPTLK